MTELLCARLFSLTGYNMFVLKRVKEYFKWLDVMFSISAVSKENFRFLV